jgi:hypothetical protein
MEQVHAGYADRDRPPSRVPSLWVLLQVLVIFIGLAGLAYLAMNPEYVQHRGLP